MVIDITMLKRVIKPEKGCDERKRIKNCNDSALRCKDLMEEDTPTKYGPLSSNFSEYEKIALFLTL